jgi:SPP1 family predicted phage head-tail adaptor
MKSFNPGVLDKRLTIQVKTQTADGMGGFSESWSTFATVFGAIWPTSAKEIVSNSALSGQITHKIRIWYLASVLSAMRILFNGRTFNIVAPPINTNEANVTLDLLCMEVV